MTIDEERILGSGPGLQLGHHVLDVPVAVSQTVQELEVETSSRFLKVDHDLRSERFFLASFLPSLPGYQWRVCWLSWSSAGCCVVPS